ncbi:MAG: hypothetical protein ACRD0U_17575, partial [Acidimicrobiales bacterium]
ELLDDLVPGWHNNIDTTTLDMGECESCVLGQLFTDAALACEGAWGSSHEMITSPYTLGRLVLGDLAAASSTRPTEDKHEDWADIHGFDRRVGNYGGLTHEWIEAIRARRRVDTDAAKDTAA